MGFYSFFKGIPSILTVKSIGLSLIDYVANCEMERKSELLISWQAFVISMVIFAIIFIRGGLF